MTVSSSVRKAGPFAGNNIATTFPFSFKVFAKGDLKVLLVNSSGVSTPLVLDSDYSVQLNANQNSTPGGWITYPISGNPLAISNEIVMLGDLTYDQETDITNAGGFYPTVIEDMVDKATIQIQQLAEVTSRALVVTEAETTSPTLPNAQARANSILGFDASGNIELFGLTPAVGAGDLRNEAWTAGVDFTAGTSSSVGLSRAYGTKANLGTVVMAGFPQDPNSYTLTNSGMTLQFDSVIPVAVNRIWCVGGTTLSVYTPPAGSVGDAQLQWGNALSTVRDSISALKALSTVVYTRAFVTGFSAPHDGGGGNYWFNPANTSAEVPGIIVAPNTGSGRWELIYTAPLNPLQFGIVADGATDNSTVLQVIRDWVAANPLKNRITFTAGVYAASVWPNWAIQNASIVAAGEVRLRNLGTGNTIILDCGSVANTFIYNVTFEGFIVEAPATAGHGLYVRSIHHSKLRGNKIEGCGATSDGIRVEFAVCTDFSDCTVTANERGSWYLNAKPLNGLHMTGRNVGEQTSYCFTANGIFEGLNAAGGAGILLESTIGNVFIGGTAEACTYGVLTGPTSVWNKFSGTDLEANTTADIYEQGTGNEYHSVDTGTEVLVTGVALWPKFFGGNHFSVVGSLGAKSPVFSKMNYNRAAGGGFTNNEPSAVIDWCFDVQAQKFYTAPQAAIPVTGSPVVYTNTSGSKQWVSIFTNGSTIASVSITRGATNQGLDATTRQAFLSPNDAVVVYYSAGTPTMYRYNE